MGTPIPNRVNEQKGSGAGPVTTYRLTPEEIAALTPAKPIGRNVTKPFDFTKKEKKPVIETKPVIIEQKSEKREPKHTKEEYLLLLITGADRAGVAKEWGISAQGLSLWLKKWGIKDLASEEIALSEYRQQLVSKTPVATASPEEDSPAELVVPEADPAELDGVAPEPAVVPVQSVVTPLPVKEGASLWIKIPLVDTNTTFGQQLEKVKEEIDELSREVNGYRGRHLALSEALDVVQSLIGALYLDMAELMSPDQAVKKLRHFLVQTNRDHVAKIQHYTADRGWKVIEA